MDYDQWVVFTFNLSPGSGSLFYERYPGGADEAFHHCLKFFQSPRRIVDRIPRASLVEAFHRIPSIDGYLGLLSYPELELTKRQELLHSQFNFFSQIFSNDDFNHTSFLWWEHLVGASWNGGPSVHDDHFICEQLLDLLERILYIESPICSHSALHGINEIGPFGPPRHDSAILRRFLASDLAQDETLRKYAMQIQAGQAP